MMNNNCVLVTPNGEAIGYNVDFNNINVALGQCKEYLIISHKDHPFIKNLSNFANAPLCLCYDKDCENLNKDNEGNNDVINDLMADYKYNGNCLILLCDENQQLSPMPEETIKRVIGILEEYHGANLDSAISLNSRGRN